MVATATNLRTAPSTAAWLALVGAALAGCASPVSTDFLSGSRREQPVTAASDQRQPTATDDPVAAAALRKATGAASISEEQAMAGILDDLKEIHAIDPAAEQQLLSDLKEVSPENYPMVVETFRTALAFRQQLADRERRYPPESTAALASHDTIAPRTRREQVAAKPASAHVEPAALASDVEPPAPERLPAPEPLPAPPVETVAAARARPAVAAPTPQAQVTPTAYAAPLQPGGWRDELAAAITQLQRTAPAQAASAEDLHAHMRLRALQLLAGQHERAYAPIPGATPAQQDYWSKQLFAMAAYLDSQPQLDEKLRARAALAPLDDARAKLSELAALEIRHLAFAKSVDGFGAYQPRDAGLFHPGELLTLYAEIENFRSTSTASGFHTTLGASYRLLDAAGTRIDGNQFGDVTDDCRVRRRDFHMQYGIPLPKQLSPGRYTLELTVTDHAAASTATTTLPLDVAGSR
jgi:hypothetical protein